MIIKKLQDYFESIKITPLSWLGGISAIIFGRFFLEAFSSPTNGPLFVSDFSTMMHYYIFFVAVALIFVIFVQVFLEKFKKTTFQFVAVFFVSIFIAPLIDFVVSMGAGFKLAYVFETPIGILKSFFTYFGNTFSQGITIGIKIEVFLILLSIGLISYLSEKNIIKSLLSVLALYFIIFFVLSFPSFVSLVGQMGNYKYSPNLYIQKSIIESSTILNNVPHYLEYSSDITVLDIAFNFMMAKMFFVIAVLSALFLFYKNQKEKFLAVMKNSRGERVAHYIFMILLGVIIAFSIFPKIYLSWFDIFSILILFLTFYFSWMFAVFVNDEEDVLIDEVTNQERPLVQKTLTSFDSKQVSRIFLILSLIGGYLSGFGPFFFLLCFTALYYMYSANPTRFKIVPFFSSFLIGLCCLSAVLAGFYLVSPIKEIGVFPTKIAVGVVLIFFLSSNIRDMKDIEGDKKAGIQTVPVLFGDVWGPRVVAILSSLAFLLVPFFVNNYVLIFPSLIFGYLNYTYVIAKPYVEKPIFKNYFSFVLISIILILI